jgi:hypothetical protein
MHHATSITREEARRLTAGAAAGVGSLLLLARLPRLVVAG